MWEWSVSLCIRAAAGRQMCAHLVEGGLCDFAHMLLHIILLGEPVGEHQTQVGGLAELAALVLGQFAEGGDGIGLGRLLDDVAEGRHGFGPLDEQLDGGVAVQL